MNLSPSKKAKDSEYVEFNFPTFDAGLTDIIAEKISSSSLSYLHHVAGSGPFLVTDIIFSDLSFEYHFARVGA